MTFSLTKYIFPLEVPIRLSTGFDYVFDNPRNDDEIKLVTKFINTTILDDDNSNKEERILPIGTRAYFSLHELIKFLEENDKENYVLRHFDKFEKKTFIDFLAQSWIIIRFPEVPEFDVLASDKSQLFTTIFEKKETTYTKAFSELSSYCHSVSLLANNNDHYHGQSFLLSNNPYEIFITKTSENVYEALESFTAYNNLVKHKENRHTSWSYWNDAYNGIITEASRLDAIVIQSTEKEKNQKVRQSQKQTPKQKIIHVGELLKTSYEHLQEPKLMLLLQVSIIEFLLTRAPDTSRFNVEDSISKQFRLKCAVLIHYRDKSYDLVKLSEDLSRIYEQRSDLAHGNHKEDFDKAEILKSVFLLFKFNRDILNTYIEDRTFLEFLKDN